MEGRVKSSLERASAIGDNSMNRERRKVYSDLGLLELDIEELRDKGKLNVEEATKFIETLRQAQDGVSLTFLKTQPKGIWRVFYSIDEAIRIAAVWCYLIDYAILVAPMSMLAHFCVPHLKLPNFFRRMCGIGCYALSNVTVNIEGITEKTFASTVSLTSFTHASTMDAFILAGAVPCGLFSLAKSELFMIPFFAWILAAYGGIAVNRGDRNQAVKALRSSAERAARNSSAKDTQGSCVAISPEGTRSKSGQLAVFKKGAFYIWDEMQMPIVPMVIFGAFDLYPPGKQMSLPGNVCVRFGSPISPDEVKSTEPAARRNEMSMLLRRRILMTLADSPPGVGDESPPQTAVQKLRHLGLVGACLGVNYGMFKLVTGAFLARGWTYTGMSIVSSAITVFISGGVYLYNLFLCTPMGGVPIPGIGSSSGSAKASGASTSSDGSSGNGKKDN